MRILAIMAAIICTPAFAEPVKLACEGGIERHPDNPGAPAEAGTRGLSLTVDEDKKELTLAGHRFNLVPSLDGQSYHGYLRGQGEWERRYVSLDRRQLDISVTFANELEYETFMGSCRPADSKT